MDKTIRDKHYESNFEFPLLKMIMKHAEEKDISLSEAAYDVMPEWNKGIRYRDREFEEAVAKEKMKVRFHIGEAPEEKPKGDK
jgi:hypothetical protein